MAKISIKFYPADKTIDADKGVSFRDVAELAGIDLRLPCGGKGRCGKCKIIFEQGAPAPTPAEVESLSEAELAQGCRLGCMTVLHEDAVVHIPQAGKAAKILTAGAARDVPLRPAITKKHARVPEPSVTDLRSDLKRVLDTLGYNGNHATYDLSLLRRLGKEIRDGGFDVTGVFADGIPITFEGGDTTGECYGVALDIGTTTMAAYLLDLDTGKQLSVASAINPQTLVGDDVISRIHYASQGEDGLKKLQSSVVNEFNRLVKALTEGAGVPAERIYEVSVVGNTCMSHLFLGIDPYNLAQAPYVPTVSQSVRVRAGDLGLEINPFGRAHVLPNIAGYVGADTVGVILSTGIYDDERTILAIDIGTNGEIVLGSRKRLLACSTAAGPAFEGAHIKHGMRAAPGAVDAAWLDEGQIGYSTVGGEKVTGICGSGLLDIIICMLQAGIIEASGRIVDADEVPEEYAHLRERIPDSELGNEFILVAEEETSIGEPVVITQRDVREVQLAKGAIAAGIATLMERMGVGKDDLDSVMLAGAFGNYVRKESAIAAGMLPDVPVTKVHSVGNAAGEGAKLSLISRDIRDEVDSIAGSVEYVELTTDFGFQERFADALMFGSGSWM